MTMGIHPLGQSFTPSLTRVDAIEFRLRDSRGNTVPAVIKVDLIAGEGYGGALIASSASQTLRSVKMETYHFDLNAVVTPGSIYTARVVKLAGDFAVLRANTDGGWAISVLQLQSTIQYDGFPVAESNNSSLRYVMEPQIVTKPEFIFIGMQERFIHARSPEANNMKVLGPLWGRFLPVYQRIPNRVNEHCYGVIEKRPEAERQHPDELLYIAGVEATSADDVPDTMVARVVPSLTYAVFTHVGPIENILRTINAAYEDWLPNSEYEHSGIADIELYDERFRPGTPECTMEYWISVEKK